MIKVENFIVQQNRFPDGTLHLVVDPTVFCLRTTRIDITWLYENDSEMFALECLVDMFRRNGWGDYLNLIMPYCPNARMDRIKSKDENFSLRVFANWLNSLNFNQVTTFNVHSNVSEALINNLCNVLPAADINYVCGRYKPTMIFFPDEGACKRYSDMSIIKELNLPITFGIKKRDWSTGEILGLDVVGENIENQRIIIIDDICSKGGTFKFSAIELKKRGASDVVLYVSHCEDTIKEGELLKTDLVSKIYTSNSICHVEDPKIEIIRKF